MDETSLAALRTLAAERHGVPADLSDRLRGETIGELLKDAEALASKLGVVPDAPRDASGRYAAASQTMNSRIRAAAGRSQPANHGGGA